MQDERGDPPELLDVDFSTPVPLSDHERMRRMKEYDERFTRKNFKEKLEEITSLKDELHRAKLDNRLEKFALNKRLFVEIGKRLNAEAECDRLRDVEEACLNRDCEEHE